jgi:UDP-N-acetylglucosamine 4,6-dehydratase
MLNGKVVLISGGTGSFGKKFIETILYRYSDVKKIIIYSRDELKQSILRQKYPAKDYPQLRFFIGDIRDRERLIQACEGVDVIIHAAAIKQVDTAEYNPTECIRATKLASDKLFAAANNIRGSKDIKFSVVRYGNVMGSRGSVIPFFMDKKTEGVLPITHADMTRFNISLQDGVAMVMYALENHLGGEIFIPKIPSYKTMDVAEAIAPDCDIVIVGIRPGEKLHEEMITDTDSLNTIDLGKYYAILPSVSYTYSEQEYIAHHKANKVPFGFRYNSGTNTEWETVGSLRALIRKHIDPDFSV